MLLGKNQKRIEIYQFLSKDLGMYLFTSDEIIDIYRKKLKDHIITIHITRYHTQAIPDIQTFLNINGVNIWWFIHKLQSGYTLDSLLDFNNTEFVRIVSRNSDVFKEDWISFADM